MEQAVNILGTLLNVGFRDRTNRETGEVKRQFLALIVSIDATGQTSGVAQVSYDMPINPDFVGKTVHAFATVTSFRDKVYLRGTTLTLAD